MKASIVYYGTGNILSVERALSHCGADVNIINTPEQILKADRIIVPGVGAFGKCMSQVQEFELKEALLEFAAKGNPYLGICVGMQMLLEKSYEFGLHEGLGLIEGEVHRIEVPGERVPFIGWKEVVFNGEKEQFYFVHSYQAIPTKPDQIQASYQLGSESVTAIVQKDNVLGVQFHPEKSAQSGIKFLKEFLRK